VRVTLSQYGNLGDSRYQVDDKVVIDGEKDATVTVRQTHDSNDDLVLVLDIEDAFVELAPHGNGGVLLFVRKR